MSRPGGHDHQDLVPLESARRWVLERCPPLSPRAVPVAEALGLVLAADVVAPASVPPFANTAMDGFALRAADTRGAPVELEVVGTLAAGAAPSAEVGPGQAVRIMTGAPMPAGADAVVMVELTEAVDGAGAVRILQAAEPGQHVRPAGEDVRAGQLLFPAGEVLSPGHLGMLASVGIESAPVVPAARVGVLSTGDELVDGGGELRPGQIRDSNRRTLLALVTEVGGRAVDLGIAGDDPVQLRGALTGALGRCDAILTSGGVSMGDFDFVKSVLDDLSGGSMRWMQVAIRPAKPFAFGVLGTVPVFGLPGNPVSSMVSFECLARPALRQMMGHAVLDRPRLRAVADEDLRRRPDARVDLVRVRAAWSGDGRLHVRSAGAQGSHLLRSMAAANALAVLPAGGEGVRAGDELDVLLLEMAGLNR